MAAVDVITTRTISCFEHGKSFFSTDTVRITKSEAPSNGENGTVNAPPSVELEMDRFPLEDQSFVDLQIYLKAALRLPGNIDAFKLTYPEGLFSTYLTKDKKSPGLYALMSKTLTDIHQHCFDFQKGPMNSMVSLAGEISIFAYAATKGVDTIASNFDIILVPGASFDDQKVRRAAEDIANTLEILQKKASVTKDECKKIFDALSAFKTTTGVDKTNLQEVTERSSYVLPTTAQLNQEMRDRAAVNYTALNNLARQENASRQKAENLSGTKWYYFVPWVGMGFAIADTVNKNQAESDLAKATREYEKIFNSASEQLRTAITFRERCKHLSDNIQTVSDAIKKAEKALSEMMGAFSYLQTNLGSIATDIDLAKGFVTEEVARRRRAARESLDNAKKTWAKVTDLASRFQQKGLVLEKNVSELSTEAPPSPWLELLSANYGGVDVTEYAKILFNYGDSIRIRTVEPGFHEPWKGVVKTISVLHQLNKSQRIFVCKEYSGDRNFHILEPKEKVSDQVVPNAELREIKPFAAPANSLVQILSIVWGPKEVRSQQVYDYCYRQLNNGNVEWKNDTMGGDTWPTVNKSGVIYYRLTGNGDIKQCTGRESTSTRFAT